MLYDYKKPWTQGQYDPRFIFDRDGDEVVTVHRHYSEAVHLARLLAMAPDMLEVLEMVRDADDDNGKRLPSLARAKIDAIIRYVEQGEK